MIRQVSLTAGTTFADPPWRFEAGSPNTAGIMGLGAAFDYVEALGLNAIHDYEQSLMHYALEALRQVPTLKIYGPAHRAGVIAFNLGSTMPMTSAASSTSTASPFAPAITARCR